MSGWCEDIEQRLAALEAKAKEPDPHRHHTPGVDDIYCKPKPSGWRARERGDLIEIHPLARRWWVHVIEGRLWRCTYEGDGCRNCAHDRPRSEVLEISMEEP